MITSSSLPGGLAISPARGEELESVLRQVCFDLFEKQLPGAIVINRDARVVWLSRSYAQLLGLATPLEAIGQDVRQLLPETRLPEVIGTGQPLLLDFMRYRDKTFVVTRLPILNEDGQIQGAAGILLYETWEPLKPMVDKFDLLQATLGKSRQPRNQQRQARYTLKDIIGQSPACLRMKTLARRAADLDTTVLLLGETGTGKELLAQAIHADSLRTNKPFVALNVAAIPETLLEAEFFGAAPGAYTGADRRGREGKFKVAHGGTLFLDEIGDMPLALQAKLLRVLQEQEIEPLGSNALEKIDVRVIAATSRDLGAMVEAGQFRADLYYRLNVLPIELPPLRQRIGDIPLLARTMLEEIGKRCGYPRRSLSPPALDWLTQQPWPGNIRQLRNALEQASMLSDHNELTLADFAPGARRAQPVRPLADTLARAEREALIDALAAASGNKTEAARLLGLGRATLYEKLAAHGLR
ncbi:sigma-54 interaction domain-containing protein [Paludibacterium paludis]|uniref:Sigma-54-dependent Fis family transcriptional regulator n=1 Tax=Paludibacterium paludis TaxID=1225769 RepID=A0A918P3X0_9NEIS|nr:sigma 54-interacting transcriptional regulator [Paludibacterium paludis]GGY18331.1 sigma-54-dependent Fis family transcriptional regulator [Paludibacterium paludis]